MKDIESLLSPRMMMVSHCVKPCEVVYDIGTDHCYIPIYLIQKKVCKKAVATDIRQGPIDKALENIRYFNLSEEIKAFVSDGISHVGEKANIVISGMGADVIINILSDHMDYAKKAEQLVIQCQSRTEHLRSFLWENGFSINKEDLILERAKVYNAFSANYIGKVESFTHTEAVISKYLIDTKHPLLHIYINKHLKKLEDMIKGLKKSNQSNQQLVLMKKEMEIIHEESKNY